MKNIFTLILLAIVALFHAQVLATVHTVSNVSGRPAQYSSLQSAVDAATTGDTLLITGGGSSYGDITINKRLVLFGEGVRSNVVNIGSLYLRKFNPQIGANGSRFYGIQVNSTVNFDGGFSGAVSGQYVMEDFIFERCYINHFHIAGSGNNWPYYEPVKNVVLRHCWFGNSINFYYTIPENIQITNCIFNGAYIGQSSAQNLNAQVSIRNSLFLNRTTSVFRDNVGGIVLENNIFYRAEPSGCQACVFNNNLTYLCNDNNIPTSGSQGSGNIVNANPLFVNFPALGGNATWSHNFGFQTGSPAIGTGTNGTNIGLFGGNAPVTMLPSEPKIPAVTELTIPVGSVPVGGTLQINLQAISRD